MGYDHPKANDGVKSHLFHVERLGEVKAHLASSAEIGISDRMLQGLVERFSTPLSESQSLVLKDLNIKVVGGLPITDVEKYTHEHALFLTTDNDPNVVKTAVAYPDAGRAITFRQGYVVGERVFIEHDEKGVGRTKSVTNDHIRKNYGPGSPVGVIDSEDVRLDIKGTNMAQEVGILVPLILPPIVLDEAIINGQIISAENYIEGEKIFASNRLWSSNVRIVNMYPGTSSYLLIRDIDLMASQKELTTQVFESRVNGYLNRAKIVEESNLRNNTNFNIGCARFLDGDYSHKNYSRAFRQQMIENVTNMFRADFYHLNLSAQNVSVASEVGDWDRYAFVNKDGSWETSDGFVLKREEAFNSLRADAAFSVLMNSYQTQGLVDAVLGSNYLTVEEYWQKITDNLGENHWAKNLSVNSLIEMSYENRTTNVEIYNQNIEGKKKSVEIWQTNLKKLVDAN